MSTSDLCCTRTHTRAMRGERGLLLTLLPLSAAGSRGIKRCARDGAYGRGKLSKHSAQQELLGAEEGEAGRVYLQQSEASRPSRFEESMFAKGAHQRATTRTGTIEKSKRHADKDQREREKHTRD